MHPTKTLSILIVDDEPTLCRLLKTRLERLGYDVRCAQDIESAKHALESKAVDVALVDLMLPDGKGTKLIRWAVANGRVTFPYIMSGHADCRNTVEAMRAGCLDVLEKPFDCKDIARRLEGHLPHGDADLASWRRMHAGRIVGESPLLVSQLQTIRRIAATQCTMLISGESGTGKELVAQALHEASDRSDKPFVALNCAALPESMIEAELFGHTKGAFTGAMGSRVGKIASANGGTLFLDEIGDMPLQAQAKLLRVLQDQKISPIGCDSEISVDVRIVAATNRDLEAMVVEGTFRNDLYFRLGVIPVHVPPLRDRGEDVLEIAEHAITQIANDLKCQSRELDKSAKQALMAHEWPGNVRELLHLLQRTLLLKDTPGAISASDLALSGRPDRPRAEGSSTLIDISKSKVHREGASFNLKQAVLSVERDMIDEALERTKGNRTEAAALLGLNRTTLVEKIRKQTTQASD